MSRIATVRKRDGRDVPFDETKIADAIFKAAQAVGGEDRKLAEELASVVAMFLEREFLDRPPGIEDIQDVVEKVLIETSHARTAKAYILYREKRARRRESLRVRKEVRQSRVATDISLLVDPGSRVGPGAHRPCPGRRGRARRNRGPRDRAGRRAQDLRLRHRPHLDGADPRAGRQ